MHFKHFMYQTTRCLSQSCGAFSCNVIDRKMCLPFSVLLPYGFVQKISFYFHLQCASRILRAINFSDHFRFQVQVVRKTGLCSICRCCNFLRSPQFKRFFKTFPNLLVVLLKLKIDDVGCFILSQSLNRRLWSITIFTASHSSFNVLLKIACNKKRLVQSLQISFVMTKFPPAQDFAWFLQFALNF